MDFIPHIFSFYDINVRTSVLLSAKHLNRSRFSSSWYVCTMTYLNANQVKSKPGVDLLPTASVFKWLQPFGPYSIVAQVAVVLPGPYLFHKSFFLLSNAIYPK